MHNFSILWRKYPLKLISCQLIHIQILLRFNGLMFIILDSFGSYWIQNILQEKDKITVYHEICSL